MYSRNELAQISDWRCRLAQYPGWRATTQYAGQRDWVLILGDVK
jgi:hypothetical protein